MGNASACSPARRRCGWLRSQTTARGARARREEEVGERVDRIGDVHPAGVGGVEAARCGVAEEEEGTGAQREGGADAGASG